MQMLKMLIVVYLFGGVYLEDHENINFTRGNHMHMQLPFWYHGGGVTYKHFGLL